MPDDWSRFNTMSQLGGALLGQGRYAEAEPLVIEGYEGMKARAAKIPRRASPACPKPPIGWFACTRRGASPASGRVEGQARPGRPARRRLRPAVSIAPGHGAIGLAAKARSKSSATIGCNSARPRSEASSGSRLA